ncbi:MFS transporter [Silvimonas iriomotensis]|uniref:Sugar:cation symporter n=1 Tax=Silvimonas iriomotensis TaxID=449662 RepID=A0ABQ2P9L6_9NEIS|nr:MFS transporter [Silvimonas iriomotensis]GGP21166.1 sugar:cation symporter [Silvimonas iriomotensis]
MNPFSPGRLAACGITGLPLAMVALPVYVLAPSWYSTELGLSLSTTGYLLVGARLFDTAQDPFLGQLVGRFAHAGRLGHLIWPASLVLIASFGALWFPAVSASTPLAVWFAITLICVYSAHAVLNISLLSWGIAISPQLQVQNRAAAWREGAGLIGVMLASVLPTWLTSARGYTPRHAMALFSGVFASCLLVAVFAWARWAPAWAGQNKTPDHPARVSHGIRQLALLVVLNGLSVSVPATLVLFYVNDHLQAPDLAGAFLAIYFLAGMAGLPLWSHLSDLMGPARAWSLGMLLAILSFVWASALQAGALYPFALICACSGLALGADLTLPPVLLARLLAPDESLPAQYGYWSFLVKLSTALAGFALPLLSAMDYHPGLRSSHTGALPLVYGVLPAVCKCAALACLQRLVRRWESS